MEPLLASSIPQLHSQAFVFDIDGLGDEIDTNSWLRLKIFTCQLPVKLSKMKRLIMEVLPTDWSPKRTILHLVAGLLSISFQIINLYIYTHYKSNRAFARDYGPRKAEANLIEKVN